MDNDIAIKAENLSKVYKIFDRPIDRLKEALNPFRKRYSKDFYALNNVSFEIKKGETVGIIGKNGAGKSTLLKIITGVLTPSSGSIQVNGRIASLLELGAGFNPEMTGIENIYMNGTVMGYSRQEMDKRIDNIVSFADIGDFIYQPVKMYSSGMFARLAFAVNAFVEPDILIVDEALSVGDIEFQNKCYRKFEELRKKRITILFVTHDINAILSYCSMSFLMEKGSIVGIGTSKDIVDLYKKRLGEQVQEKSDKIKENLNVRDDNLIENRWKDSLKINKNLLEYGDKDIEIIDFAIIDATNKLTTVINNEQIINIKMKIKVNKDVNEPIFAFSIKDLKGTEIAGSNTYITKTKIGKLYSGEVLIINFKQKIPIQVGDYALSLGCTEYVNNGLAIHHRLYDVLFLKIVSFKSVIGLVDINSKISIEKI